MHITTAPHLQVIVGHPEVFHEFDRLMQIKSDDVTGLFYDTTFETGHYYISTLSFKHFLFEGEPIFPLSFLIHERRLEQCHEDNFRTVARQIPRLKNKSIPIVTDRE